MISKNMIHDFNSYIATSLSNLEPDEFAPFSSSWLPLRGDPMTVF